MSDDTFLGFLKAQIKLAKRTQAGSTMVSFKKGKNLEGYSCYILLVKPGCELDGVASVINSMTDEDCDSEEELP